MSRTSSLSSALALAAVLGFGFGAGCVGSSTEDTAALQREAVMAACHLNDGTVEADADLHACDPQDTKKTTICHIPPGNPANAHTLCIGNPAVAPHIKHHGDYLGACKQAPVCEPPAGGPSDNGPGDHGPKGGDDQGGTGGAGAPAATGGASGAGSGGSSGAGGAIIIK